MVKVALLVGVSEYEYDLNPLPKAVNDIEAMQQVLQKQDIGGFAETDVMLLKNPDRQQMEEAIENLFADRQKDDLVLFFFSGHGIKDDYGKLYLATHKTRKNPQGYLSRATAVSASFIHDSMSRSRSKRQVVILDSCFSGAFAEGLLAKDDGTVNIQEQLGGEGRAVLTSSTSTQYSFEQDGSDFSVYTRYLVEGMNTGAADLDDDGVISIDELHEYASKKVREAQPSMTPEIYAIREGFKIRLAKVPLLDPKQKYRKEVARFISRGEISFVGRRTLDVLRTRWELLAEEATAIENEILEPYRKEFREKLQQYEQVFTALIKRELTISETDRNDLQNLQQILQLRNEDTVPIEETVTARIKVYRENLRQYEQEFSGVVRREYPLSESTSNQLQQMQQHLELADADIAPIKARITAEIKAYKQKLQQYENIFVSATQEEYPLSKAKRQNLQQQQRLLKLTDEDIAPIEARIITQIEEYQQKLQQYEQLLNDLIRHEYPISDETREELRRFQQTLELNDSDITLIEERVFKSREVVQPIADNFSPSLTFSHQQHQQLFPEQDVTPIPVNLPNPNLSDSSGTQPNTSRQMLWKAGAGLAAGVAATGIAVVLFHSSPTPTSPDSSSSTPIADLPNLEVTPQAQAPQEDAQSELRRKQLNEDIRAHEQQNNTFNNGSATNRSEGALATEVRDKLEANIINSHLTVEARKDGRVVVGGTVTNLQQLAKIAPLAKQIKGVTSVVVNVKVDKAKS